MIMLAMLSEASQLLIKTFLELYIFIVCLRILLHWANVSYANPVLIAIARVTHPSLRLIYSIVPTVNGLDLASLVLLSFLAMFKIAILFWWQTGYIPPFLGLSILAFSEILGQFIGIFFFIILLFSLMSWVHSSPISAVVEIVVKMGGPLCRLASNLLPPIEGMDFSPVLAMLGLQLLKIFVVNPLAQIGIELIKITITNAV